MVHCDIAPLQPEMVTWGTFSIATEKLGMQFLSKDAPHGQRAPAQAKCRSPPSMARHGLSCAPISHRSQFQFRGFTRITAMCFSRTRSPGGHWRAPVYPHVPQNVKLSLGHLPLRYASPTAITSCLATPKNAFLVFHSKAYSTCHVTPGHMPTKSACAGRRGLQQVRVWCLSLP